MIRGLLDSAEIESAHRATQSGDKFGGAWEVLVHPEDFETARSLLPVEE